MKKIYIIGHQRSGNVWLSRCLGDMYNCDIAGGEGRNPISKRTGQNKDVKIIQDHFSMSPNQGCFISHLCINPQRKPKDCVLIFMHRNPFDVAVSAYYYWNKSSAIDTLKQLKNGGYLTPASWQDYTLGWLEKSDELDAIVTYEQMRRHPTATINYLRDIIGIKPVLPVDKVIALNTIEETKKRINRNPSNYSYNKQMQLKHIRKGQIGDWKSHFSTDEINEVWYGKK